MPETPDDLASDIAQQAVEPSASAGDGHSTSGRPIDDLIKADRYLAAKAARSRKRRGLTFTKLIPPGAAGDAAGGTSPCGGC